MTQLTLFPDIIEWKEIVPNVWETEYRDELWHVYHILERWELFLFTKTHDLRFITILENNPNTLPYILKKAEKQILLLFASKAARHFLSK